MKTEKALPANQDVRKGMKGRADSMNNKKRTPSPLSDRSRGRIERIYGQTYVEIKVKFDERANKGRESREMFGQGAKRGLTSSERALLRKTIKRLWAYPEASFEEVRTSAMRLGRWPSWREYHIGPYILREMDIDGEKRRTMLEVSLGDYDRIKYIWVPYSCKW